jgi:cytochrome c oxidase subunit 2
MQKPVIVSNQSQFTAWVEIQKANAAQQQKTPEGQGQLLTVKNGCTGCHSLTSSPLPQAPAWFGLFGSKVQLADGTTVIADEAYLTESIKTPKAKEVKGYSPSTMPQFVLTDEEIANIVAYIKTLK